MFDKKASSMSKRSSLEENVDDSNDYSRNKLRDFLHASLNIDDYPIDYNKGEIQLEKKAIQSEKVEEKLESFLRTEAEESVHIQQDKAATSSKRNNEENENSEEESDNALSSVTGSFTQAMDAPDPLEEKVRENNRFTIRAMMALALLILAVIVIIILNVIMNFSQNKAFYVRFEDTANEFKIGFDRNLNITLGIAATMASVYQANFPDIKQWPNITFRDFEILTKHLHAASDLRTLTFEVLVTNETRTSWEAYAAENAIFFNEPSLINRTDNNSWIIADGIYQKNENGEKIYDPGYVQDSIYPSLLMPVWQIYPFSQNKEAVMFNGRAGLIRQRAVEDMILYKHPTLTSVLNLVQDNSTIPSSILFFPIIHSSGTILGAFLAAFSWETTFQHVLPIYIEGFVCVLSSSSGDVNTFVINGNESEFLGSGDLHDPKYNQMKVEFSVSIAMNYHILANVDNLVNYTIEMYPSDLFRSIYYPEEKAKVTGAIFIVFAVTSVIFFIYDILLHKYLRHLKVTVSNQNKIVNSIYPDKFRERFFTAGGMESQKKEKKMYNYFLEENGFYNYFKENNYFEAEVVEIIPLSEPIADFFDSTTIMFADIGGFSSWSSSHEPKEVFLLLESVFIAFDKIAKKLGVFKVETIGDCYVAVCGLPDPRIDHAVIMSQFALECQRKFNKVMETLSNIDVKHLRLRTGLHSGPVTAGILRGDKSRFQLFGDTMNTASRMESTGEPGRVQISQQTKDLLDEAKKSSWYTPRKKLVAAKGKGFLQTYWLIPNSHLKDISPSLVSALNISNNDKRVESTQASVSPNSLHANNHQTKILNATSSRGIDDGPLTSNVCGKVGSKTKKNKVSFGYEYELRSNH